MDIKIYTVVIGALVGWVLKMFFEHATGVKKRNRLARKAYFQLFALLRQVESAIDSVEIFGLSESKITTKNIEYWKRTLEFDDYARIRKECFAVLSDLAEEAPKISARTLELFTHIEILLKYRGVRPNVDPEKITIGIPKTVSELLRSTHKNLIEILDLLDKQSHSYRLKKEFRDFDVGPEEPTMADRVMSGIIKERAARDGADDH